MTRLEKVLKQEAEELLQCACPGDEHAGPIIEYDTHVRNADNNTTGCRGITCEECWNTEYKEDEG